MGNVVENERGEQGGKERKIQQSPKQRMDKPVEKKKEEGGRGQNEQASTRHATARLGTLRACNQPHIRDDLA
jgi:hypothetical protein